MIGIVSNIQRFSTKDGPGLRTTVFVKGCPLRCPWCHNMETWEQQPSLLYYEKDCIQCGLCTQVCPHGAHVLKNEVHSLNRIACVRCGICAQECPVGALEIRGENMTPEQVMTQVLRDRAFYEQSGGGVTFSGGEVLMQFDFVRECLMRAKAEGLHTCLDTSGWGGRAQELMPYVDLYLWDIKHTDALQHKKLTGVELEPILTSLRETDAAGGHIRLRCPIIPGLNDTPTHLAAVGTIANTLQHLEAIDLLAYHALGTAKTAALGLPVQEYSKLTAEHKQELLTVLQNKAEIPCMWA